MKTIAQALAIGIILGVLTSFGQTYLPEPIKQFANSYSVWLLVAFVFGLTITRRSSALLGGGIVQVAALIGYYLMGELRFDSGYGARTTLLFWFISGVVGGPLLSLAGCIYASKSRLSVLAALGMTMVILSEAVYMFGVLHYIAQGVYFLALAIVFLAIALLHARLPKVSDPATLKS